MKRLFALTIAIFLSAIAFAERGIPVTEDNPLRSCTICCAGDFVIHDNVIDSARANGKLSGAQDTYDFAPMLQFVSPYLSYADFTVTNVDGIMGDAAFVKKYGYAGYPSFSTPASLLKAIKGCGVDMLTMANNHALDYWFDGLKSSVSSVEDAGLLHTGAYRSQAERNDPLIININGINIGILNYTDSLNMMDKRSALDKDALKYGVNFTEYWDYKKDIAQLRSTGAEVILCFMHWGIEYRTTPCQSQINKANALAEAGVDVIIGGHPHMVQKCTYIGDTLCMYSMGNFLSDQRSPGRDCGVIFDFTLQERDDGSFYVSNWSYTPTYVWRKAKQNGGYEYRVLISSDYTDSRPAGMSNADYARMLESIKEIQAIMGV